QAGSGGEHFRELLDQPRQACLVPFETAYLPPLSAQLARHAGKNLAPLGLLLEQIRSASPLLLVDRGQVRFLFAARTFKLTCARDALTQASNELGLVCRQVTEVVQIASSLVGIDARKDQPQIILLAVEIPLREQSSEHLTTRRNIALG